ncbi:MAG: efflux RND transporter permease subunit [Desulfobacterales bacterium]
MLSKFFLERPVFAWVIAIILMVAGCLAIYHLPISQYPPIAPPSIAISAFYPGRRRKRLKTVSLRIIEQKMTGFDKCCTFPQPATHPVPPALNRFSRGLILIWPGPRCRTSSSWLWRICRRWFSPRVRVSKSTRNYLLIVGLTSDDGSRDATDLQDYAQSNLEKVLARVPGVGEVRSSARSMPCASG